MFLISEENELRVKFVIDDSDFRNQLDRLRQDLEGAERLDMGVREDERRRPDVRVMLGETRVEGVDPEVMRDINRRFESLEQRVSLPKVFEESTPEQMQSLLREALKMPGWENILQNAPDVADRFAFIIGEAVRRHPGERITDIRRGGDIHTAGALRRLYDAIYHISGILETRREVGVGTESWEALRQMAINAMQITTPIDDEEVGARVSATHRAEQIVLRDLLTKELGKVAGLEMRRGRNIYDVMAEFIGPLEGRGEHVFREEEEGTGWAIIAAEVTGARAQGAKAEQVGKYIKLAIDRLREHYSDVYQTPEEFKEYLLRYPRVKAGGQEAGRVKLVLDFITSMKQGELAADVKDYLLTGTLEDREFYQKMFQYGGIEIVPRGMPEELQRRLAEGWAPGITGEQLVPIIWDYMEEFPEYLEKTLTLLNPSFNEQKLEDARGRIREIIGMTGPREARRERGQTALRQLMEQEGPQYVMQAMQEVVGEPRGTLFPGISSRVGRGRRAARRGDLMQRLPEYFPGLVDMLMEMGDEELPEAEQIERVVEAITVPPRGRERGLTFARRRELQELAREQPEFLDEVRRLARESGGREFAVRLGVYDDAGDLIDDQGPGAAETMSAIAGEMRQALIPMRGLPVGVDWREYLKGMQQYTTQLRKELGVKITPATYMRWAFEKARGQLPEEILGVEGEGEGLVQLMQILRQQPDMLPPILQEYISELREEQPALPSGMTQIDAIRDGLAGLAAMVEFTQGMFDPQTEGLITRLVAELEAYDRLHTRLEPATSITIMKWS